MNSWELHPTLVHFPIALLLCGLALDIYAYFRQRLVLHQAATVTYITGVAFGYLAAAAGLLALFTMPETHAKWAETTVYWHLGWAIAAVLIFTVIAVVRWRRWSQPIGVWSWVIGAIAAAGIIVAGYLGGDMVYHGGVGVDPNVMRPGLHEESEHEHNGEVALGLRRQ